MSLSGLEVMTTDAVANVRINDIPVAVVGLANGVGSAFIPIPSYIVRGQNRLSVRLLARGPSAPSARLRIALFQEGDRFFTQAGRELAAVDWQGLSSPDFTERTFEADFGPWSWSWSECDIWASATNALADAAPFVRDLTRAYFAADADWIEAVSRAKFSDLAEAFSEVPVDEMKAQVAAVIRDNPATLAPDREPPVPFLCCHGRLLRLEDRSGERWFRRLGSDGSGAEMLLGRFQGEWQVIR